MTRFMSTQYSFNPTSIKNCTTSFIDMQQIHFNIDSFVFFVLFTHHHVHNCINSSPRMRASKAVVVAVVSLTILEFYSLIDSFSGSRVRIFVMNAKIAPMMFRGNVMRKIKKSAIA
jgi:hypothetical protein